MLYVFLLSVLYIFTFHTTSNSFCMIKSRIHFPNTRIIPIISLTKFLMSTAAAAATIPGASANENAPVDAEYPGTAVIRMLNIRERVRSLTPADLNGEWENVRKKILWAGGLKDLRNVKPGMGYTGHSFNDYNHCDLTAMLGQVSSNENQGLVEGIQFRNQLGPGIKIASIDEGLGEGGSWSTWSVRLLNKQFHIICLYIIVLGY